MNLFAGPNAPDPAGRNLLDRAHPGWLGQEHAEELLAKPIANAAWEQRDHWMVNRRVIEPRLTAEYTDLADAP